MKIEIVNQAGYKINDDTILTQRGFDDLEAIAEIIYSSYLNPNSWSSLTEREKEFPRETAWKIMKRMEGRSWLDFFEYGQRNTATVPAPKFFDIIRHADETGVSGTGVVIKGIIMPSGMTIIQWESDIKSTTIYETFEDMLQIHVVRHPSNNHELRLYSGIGWEARHFKQDEIEAYRYKKYL